MSQTPSNAQPVDSQQGVKSAMIAALAKSQQTNGLIPRQAEMAQALEQNAKRYGPFAPDPGAANYQDGKSNSYGDGISCQPCVFFLPDSSCKIVATQVDPQGACRLYVIPASGLQGGGVAPGADAPDPADDQSPGASPIAAGPTLR